MGLKPRVEPTEYQDSKAAAIAPSLANIEIKIGAADSGEPGRVYTFSGETAKADAKTVFGGGPLLDAIDDAFDTGSAMIYAARLGAPVQATFTMKNLAGQDAVRLDGGYSAAANNHFVNIDQTISNVLTEMVGLSYIGSGYQITRPGATGNGLVTSLPSPVALIPDNGSQQLSGTFGYLALCVTTGQNGQTTLYHLNGSGGTITADTVSITSLLPSYTTGEGENVVTHHWVARGLIANSADPEQYSAIVVCDLGLLFITISGTVGTLAATLEFDDCGITTPDIVAAGYSYSFADAISGVGVSSSVRLLALDKTTKKLYRLVQGDTSTTKEKELNLSTLAGTAVPAGFAYDVVNDTYSFLFDDGKLVKTTVNWTLDTPTCTAVTNGTQTITGLKSIAVALKDATFTATVTIQDRNQSPVVTRTYQAVGSELTVTPAIVAAINADGTYSATQLLSPCGPLSWQTENPDEFDPFINGADSPAISNANILDGLTLMESRKDAAWIHVVGAYTPELWTAILLHCDRMQKVHLAERFALLETPPFPSTAKKNSAQYLKDLDDYVEDIVGMMDAVADKNAVVFAGGAKIMGRDGVIRKSSVVASVGGTVAGLPIHKSWIHKRLINVVASKPAEDSLVPEFRAGDIEKLLAAHCNMIEYDSGYIITECLTGAPKGSDYGSANELRVCQYAAKLVREACKPFVGEENDDEGDGLSNLSDAAAKPLEQLKKNKHVEKYSITATGAGDDLGNSEIRFGLRMKKTFKHIFNTIYLKSQE